MRRLVASLPIHQIIHALVEISYERAKMSLETNTLMANDWERIARALTYAEQVAVVSGL